MKHFLLALILLSSISHAQNYQCLQSGVKRYFTNGDGYLRGIRIDSVKTMGDTTVYYPFHSRRGNNSDFSTPLDSNGASWLGKAVLQLADGTFLFDNMWHNTVRIRTQAHIGDSWIFYSDTSTRYYKAHVISEGVMALPGGDDSVKVVKINAYDIAGLASGDYVNDFIFTMSKNHGFATIFDLYTFPFTFTPSSGFAYDYILNFVTMNSWAGGGPTYPSFQNSIFSVVSLVNPTYEQLYDWHPGDVFENQIFWYGTTSDGVYPYGYYFDSITDKTSSASSILFTFAGWRAFMHYPPFTMVNPDAEYPYDTLSTSGMFSISNDLLIDTTMMPEEKDQPWFISYVANDLNKALPWVIYNSPYDTTNCLVANQYKLVQTGLPGDHYFGPSEGTPISRIYKTGIGLVNYHWDILGGSPPEVQDTTLRFYVKNGDSCGNYYYPSHIYHATEVQKLQKSVDITLYPNPATTQITIQSNNQLIDNITITNFLGQNVYRLNGNSKTVTVDISDFPVGVYFVKINGADVKKFVKE